MKYFTNALQKIFQKIRLGVKIQQNYTFGFYKINIKADLYLRDKFNETKTCSMLKKDMYSI